MHDVQQAYHDCLRSNVFGLKKMVENGDYTKYDLLLSSLRQSVKHDYVTNDEYQDIYKVLHNAKLNMITV